jgi:hypothetical protein
MSKSDENGQELGTYLAPELDDNLMGNSQLILLSHFGHLAALPSLSLSLIPFACPLI